MLVERGLAQRGRARAATGAGSASALGDQARRRGRRRRPGRAGTVSGRAGRSARRRCRAGRRSWPRAPWRHARSSRARRRRPASMSRLIDRSAAFEPGQEGEQRGRAVALMRQRQGHELVDARRRPPGRAGPAAPCGRHPGRAGACRRRRASASRPGRARRRAVLRPPRSRGCGGGPQRRIEAARCGRGARRIRSSSSSPISGDFSSAGERQVVVGQQRGAAGRDQVHRRRCARSGRAGRRPATGTRALLQGADHRIEEARCASAPGSARRRAGPARRRRRAPVIDGLAGAGRDQPARSCRRRAGPRPPAGSRASGTSSGSRQSVGLGRRRRGRPAARSRRGPAAGLERLVRHRRLGVGRQAARVVAMREDRGRRRRAPCATERNDSWRSTLSKRETRAARRAPA